MRSVRVAARSATCPPSEWPAIGTRSRASSSRTREQVALVIPIPVRIAVLAEPVTVEVERDHPQAGEQRDDAEPVRRVAGQAVQQDDGRPRFRLGVGQPVRAAILRLRRTRSTDGFRTAARFQRDSGRRSWRTPGPAERRMEMLLERKNAVSTERAAQSAARLPAPSRAKGQRSSWPVVPLRRSRRWPRRSQPTEGRPRRPPSMLLRTFRASRRSTCPSQTSAAQSRTERGRTC
jgi:hypothetical protein